jgi:hypothetical protein
MPVLINPVGVIRIERDVRLEKITGAVRRGEPADARRAVRVAPGAAGAGLAVKIVARAGEVAEDASDFSGGGVLKEFLHPGDGKIVHEFLRDHLNGCTQILDILLQAPAGQRLGGIIALVSVLLHEERGQFNRGLGRILDFRCAGRLGQCKRRAG